MVMVIVVIRLHCCFGCISTTVCTWFIPADFDEQIRGLWSSFGGFILVGSVVSSCAIFNACSARHADRVIGTGQFDTSIHEGIRNAVDVGQIGEDLLCPANRVFELSDGWWIGRADGFLEGHLDRWAASAIGLGQIGTGF